jgi:hypothetical protein
MEPRKVCVHFPTNWEMQQEISRWLESESDIQLVDIIQEASVVVTDNAEAILTDSCRSTSQEIPSLRKRRTDSSQRSHNHNVRESTDSYGCRGEKFIPAHANLLPI